MAEGRRRSAAALALLVAGCGVGRTESAPGVEEALEAEWVAEDWDIFAAKVRFGAEQGLAEAPLGEAIARLAVSFEGTTYKPGTLEVEGPERLVINFRELDCVTFVETVLALTRFVREDGVELLAEPDVARARYERYLAELRYRDGAIDGYPSRLHYFSEWLSDNADRGLVELLDDELGAAVDTEPIDFMSTHPDAYRQLSDPEVRDAIARMEARLNAGPGRAWVPENAIPRVADRIRDGDVIAATSTVPGLDIAHTGLAVWIDGRLRLVHAPLVGKAVEISALPLADRILSISSQDGIMVARPTF